MTSDTNREFFLMTGLNQKCDLNFIFVDKKYYRDKQSEDIWWWPSQTISRNMQ
jgi:hypothetical protein